MTEAPTSNQSATVRAGNAFVAKFGREPASASDAAWLNGYAEALPTPVETAGDDLGPQIYALLVRRGYAQHEADAIANGPGCTLNCVQNGYPDIDCPEHGRRAVEPSGVSPYKCMFCGNKYSTVLMLNSHEETCQQERAAVNGNGDAT